MIIEHEKCMTTIQSPEPYQIKNKGKIQVMMILISDSHRQFLGNLKKKKKKGSLMGYKVQLAKYPTLHLVLSSQIKCLIMENLGA